VVLGHCHVDELFTQNDAFYLNLGTWLDGSQRYAVWQPDQEAFPNVLSCPKMKE
jgi:hypothetical protein